MKLGNNHRRNANSGKQSQKKCEFWQAITEVTAKTAHFINGLLKKKTDFSNGS